MFETVLSDEDMVAEFGDTSSTLMPLELAPPTKEMMYWLDGFTDGLFFFNRPGHRIHSKKLRKARLFYYLFMV